MASTAKISLVDVDGHRFPNLALMKLSAWHKQNGDSVEWYSPLLSRPDRIYASKVFTFTQDYQDYAPSAPPPIRGGTGYDATAKLPDEVERTLPDYSIYPEFSQALGFLSRGCREKRDTSAWSMTWNESQPDVRKFCSLITTFWRRRRSS